MAKLGEIPQGEKIDWNHPDFWVVEGPDRTLHYAPNEIVHPDYYNPDTGEIDESFWLGENGDLVAESAEVHGRIGARSFIGPETIIYEGSEIGEGVIVEPRVRIKERVIIGPDTIIRRKSTVHADARVGAGVDIKAHVHIGGGAIIEDGSRVNRNSIVPSGATVTGTYYAKPQDKR